MSEISISGSLHVKNDKFVLRVGSLEYALTLAQFVEALKGAVGVGEGACPKLDGALRCMKATGHDGKHHYRRKVYVRKTLPASCSKSGCSAPPKKGSKLCLRHYRIVVRAQQKGVATRNAKTAGT